MARISRKSLGSFYRTHQSSLYTFIMLAAERVLQMCIGLWIASHIARRFDHATFANWQIAMSLWLVFGTIGSISGERVLLPRICAEPPETLPRLWNTALAAKIISGLLTAVPLVLWCATMPDPTILQLALLWAVVLLIGQPVSLAVHELYAQENFRFPQIARIIGMFTRLGVVVWVMAVGGPVTWVVWGWIGEIGMLTVLLCWRWIPQRRIHLGLVDWKLMFNLFAQGAALAVASSASVALSRIDRVTLGKTMPADVLSQYAAAMTLLEAAFAFGAMLAVVVGAKTLFKPGAINRNHHIGLALFAGGIAFCLTLVLDLIANPLMTAIYGAKYADSATYLRIAAGLLPLVFAQAILQAPLLIRATKTYHVTKAVTAFGLGAAVATLAAHHEMYTWISAGAYVGYLTLILFDLFELRRRSAEIYGTAASPAAEGAVTAASSPAAATSPTPVAAPVPAPAAATPASPASPGAPATPATEPHSNPT
jgi:membrane protein